MWLNAELSGRVQKSIRGWLAWQPETGRNLAVDNRIEQRPDIRSIENGFTVLAGRHHSRLKTRSPDLAGHFQLALKHFNAFVGDHFGDHAILAIPKTADRLQRRVIFRLALLQHDVSGRKKSTHAIVA